eukprot:gene27188-35918_t
MERSTKSSSSKSSTASVNTQKSFEIDFVGGDTYHVSQESIFNTRSLDIKPSKQSQLSARGLLHRPAETFLAEVRLSSRIIERQLKKDVGNLKPAPHLYMTYFQRALASERLHHLDHAVVDYTACLAINDQCKEAYFNRAGIYNIKSKFQLALKDLDDAIRLDPSNCVYREFRQQEYIATVGANKALMTVEARLTLVSAVVFKDWSEEDISTLAQSAIIRKFGSGHTIVTEGEKVNCVYLIKNGLIRLSKRVEKPQVYIAPNSSPSIFGRSSVSSVSSVSLPTIVAKNSSPVPVAKDTPVKDSGNSFAGLTSYQEGNEAEEESGGGGDGGGGSSDVMMAESSFQSMLSSLSSPSLKSGGSRSRKSKSSSKVKSRKSFLSHGSVWVVGNSNLYTKPSRRQSQSSEGGLGQGDEQSDVDELMPDLTSLSMHDSPSFDEVFFILAVARPR